MRILFLTAQLPEPQHAGGALRINGLMRAVHAAGHEVHVLAFAEPEQLRLHGPALKHFCASVQPVPPPPRRTALRRLRDLLLTASPDMQHRYESPQYAARLANQLRETAYDLVQIESLEMATYLPVIKRVCPELPVIYDAFNAEYELQHSMYEAERHSLQRAIGALYSLAQWRRLTRFERQVCLGVRHVVAVSEADAAALQRLAPGASISVVPNGIDASLYSTTDTTLALGTSALVFTGSMSYRPNVDAALWFADDILGRIRARVPAAKFFIVGSSPHPRLDALRERQDVQITGWVPDVNPFLHAAAIYVVPMRMGSGTRLKLLQAMAAGKAVVATPMGAQGLHVRDGVELRLAKTAEAFAQITAELLEDPAQRLALGAAASAYVRAHYDWSVIAPRLLQLYDEIHASARHATHEEEPDEPASAAAPTHR